VPGCALSLQVNLLEELVGVKTSPAMEGREKEVLNRDQVPGQVYRDTARCQWQDWRGEGRTASTVSPRASSSRRQAR